MMDRHDNLNTAAEMLVAGLEILGVPRVFCVPGESYLPVLDALSRSHKIATVTCRHEGGAGYMALAEAKMSLRAGVAIVSRGPGASNASIAVHLAEQDAAPGPVHRGYSAVAAPQGRVSGGGLCPDVRRNRQAC